VLREEHLGNDAFRERFKTEARAVAKMDHLNIVNVYDVGNDGDINFIVMEYINGETLKELILKRAPFDSEVAADVASQIAAALAHAHKNGVIHRDIKPQNILITHNGTVKVADFGIARSSMTDTAEPTGGSTLGSVHYISPEQAKGGRITAQSDLYALGILMFEMLTGTLPFDADNAAEIALMHLHEPMPDVRALNPDVFASMAGIIQNLTKKDPAERYDDAERLVKDLGQAAASPAKNFGVKAPKSRKASNALDPSLEKKVYIAAVCTALLIVALLAAVIVPRIVRNPSGVNMPDLSGVKFETAAAQLETAGVFLNIEREDFSDAYDAGVILHQNYRPGETVPKGTTVNVAVSKGAEVFEVPDLRGEALESVIDRKLPFTVIEDSYEYSGETPQDAVIDQSPRPGEVLPKGGELRLVISRGEELKKITVPDVVGMTEESARLKIEGMGLAVGQVGRSVSERYDKGIVSSQSPGGGREAFAGTKVSFTVSDGKPEPTPAPAATPAQTAGPTPAPEPTPTPAPVPSTRSFQIGAPNEEEGYGATSVQLSIARKDENGLSTVYNERVQMADFPVTVTFTDVGLVEYQIYVNGLYRASHTVDFRQ
jgi:serine/threonine-protein kinase